MIPIRLDIVNSHEYLDHLSDELIRHIDRVLRNGGIYKNKPRRLISLSPRLKKLLINFKQGDVFERLVFAKPELISRVVNILFNKWDSSTKPGDPDYEILYNIFVKYLYSKINREWLIDCIETDSCSYCNRNYIYKIESGNKQKIITPDLDHFYPKNKYPLLAASVYNLVPCCSVCNGIHGKHLKDPYIENIVSPYQLNQGDFIFTYKLISLSKKNPLSGLNVEVILDKMTGSNAEVFNLHEFYKKHDDHVSELIVKSKLKYNRRFKIFLKTRFMFKFDNDEINRFILGNYSKEEEVHKRPLAKLYQDIGKELGLI